MNNRSYNGPEDDEKLDKILYGDDHDGFEGSSKSQKVVEAHQQGANKTENNDIEATFKSGSSKIPLYQKVKNVEDEHTGPKNLTTNELKNSNENNQLINSEATTQKTYDTTDPSAVDKVKNFYEEVLKKFEEGIQNVKKGGYDSPINMFLIKKRRYLRILLLIGFEATLIYLIIWNYTYGFIRGSTTFVDSDSIEITTNNCQIKIIDYSLFASNSIDLNFLTNIDVPTSLSDNLLLTYVYPENGTSSKSETNDNFTKKLYFTNDSELLDCQIVIYVYKQTKLNSLDINCESECQIFYASTLLSSTTLNIQGPKVTINAPNLIVEDLSFTTQFGTFESSNILFTTATIETSNGDISLQSLKSIEVDVELSQKLYCVSTFNSNPITDSVAQVAKSSCKNVFAYGDLEKDAKNNIATRCYQGKIIIKSGGSEANQLLKAGNTEGNLFINVLPREGAAADSSNNVFVYDSTVYGDEGDEISLSADSSTKFSEFLKLATKPNIYDPIFIFQIGKQFDLSSSYSQWQMTFNPAYSYLRPWWLGTLTLGLLNSQQFIQDVTLAPGFCPHVPSLSQKRQYIIQTYLKSLFVSQTNHESFILTQSQSEHQPLPPVKFSSSTELKGWANQILSDFYSENWINYKKQLDETISVFQLDLDLNITLRAALYVSIILAALIGIIILIGVVYAINKSYILLLDHISNVEMYGILDKDNQEFGSQTKQTQSTDQQNLKNYHGKVGEIKKQQEYNYTINGLYQLFTNLITLSPPLSAYIDQIVIIYTNASRNSVVEFYSFLFREISVNEKSSDKIIHNLEKDSINGQELKALYEKFCYVNQLYERKLDDELSSKEVQKKGFKIVKMYDSLEFCSINHLTRLQVSEGQLKENYGIETRYDPLQVIIRDSNYNLKVQKSMYVVDKNRLINYLNLLLAKNLKDSYQYNNENKESLKIIYSPKWWIFYDSLTVLAHLTLVLLIGSPFIGLTINIRAQQSEYSSTPLSRQIFYEDLITMPAAIPYKLASDGSILSLVMLILTAIFWVLSTLDLILYYFELDFPQDQYFKKYNSAGLLRRVCSKVMWVLFLIIIYSTIVYLSLLGTWLVLSAIINPEAFLPYATSVATFVTLIIQKYQQFKQISDNGFKIIIDFLKQNEQSLFRSIIHKMDIGLNSTKLLPTEAIKQIFSEASNLGLIDQKYSEGIQENLELMIRDPEAVSHLGQNALSIARDPRQAVSDLISKIESKTKIIVEEQLQQYLPLMYKSLTSLIIAMFKGNKQQVAQEISIVFSDLYAESLQKEKDDPEKIQFLNILKGPLVRLLLEFNPVSTDGSRDDQIDKIMQSFSIVTSQFIATKFFLTKLRKNEIRDFQNQNQDQSIESEKQKNTKENKSLGSGQDNLLKQQLNFVNKKSQITQKTLDVANSALMTSLYKIKSYSSANNLEKMLIEFLELVPNLQNLPQFKKTVELNQFTDILTLIIKANSGNLQIPSSQLHPIFRNAIQQSNIENELELKLSLQQLLDFIILVMNSTLKLEKSLTMNEIKSMFQQLFKDQPQKVSSIVAFVLLQIRNGQSKIPIDTLQDVIYSLKQTCEKLSDKNTEKLLLSQLNQVLQSRNHQNGVSQQRLYLIQDIFSFFNDISSNFKAQFKILEKNSRSGYGLPEDSSQFVINLLKQKFRINTKEEDKALISSKDFLRMAKIMKMSTFELQGFIHFLIGKSQSVQYRGFISCIFRQYKVDESVIDQLIYLQNLLCSKNEYDLNEALSYFFQKPMEAKIKKTNPKKEIPIKSEHIPIILLFIRKQFDYQYCKQFIEENLKDYFDFSNVSNTDEILQQIKKAKYEPAILEVLIKDITIGSITPKQIKSFIDILGPKKTIEGLMNKVFGQVVSLQNLYFEQITPTSTQFKESVINLSNLLNLEEKKISAFVSLILCQGDRTFDNLVDSFQIPIQSYNGYKFIENYVSMMDEHEQNQHELEKVAKSIFDSRISKETLHSVLNHMAIPWKLENIYFLFNLTDKEIPKKLNMLIKFAFGIIGEQQLQKFTRKLIMNDQQISKEKTQLPKEKIIIRQKGLLTLLSLFKNQNKRENIQIFLQYLYDSDQEQLLIKNCLLCYFGGISEGVIFTIKEKNGSLEMSIQEFLSYEMDIKIEFFNALPALFCNDLLNFSSQFIKFFRQVDYQQQKLQKQNQKQKVKLNQVVPQKGSEKKEEKSSVSDNFENNITISDKEVEQYIKLVKGDSINTSFFSRDLQLHLDVVECLEALNQIKAQNLSAQRIILLQQLKNNQSVLRIFSEIKVKVEDFINGILFMYKDFDIFDEILIKAVLNMTNEDNSSIIKNLLLLDQDTDPTTSDLQRIKFLSSTMEKNEILGHLRISPEHSTLTHCLTQDFFLLKELHKKNIILKLALSDSEQMQDFLFGMIGVIQRRKLKISSETFYKSLYLTLKTNNDNKKESQSTQENERLIQNITPENTFEHAIVLLYKETQLSPVWILLKSHNMNAWEYYLQRYYRTFRYKISKKPSYNPVITLFLILKLQQTSTLIKEMISQLEVVLSYQEIQPESQQQFQEYENTIIRLIENLLDSSKDNIVELARQNNFPSTIIKHIAAEERCYLEVQDPQNLSEEEIIQLSLKKSRENILNDPNIKNNYRKFVQNLYSQVDQECFKEKDSSVEDQMYSDILHLNPISHLLLISSINQLSVASQSLFHHTDLGIDHHKQTSYLIDFILTTFDKFYLFKFKKASFFKKYLTPILGIAAGFSIDENIMIECNPTCNILSFEDLKKKSEMSPEDQENREKKEQVQLLELKKEKAKLVFDQSVKVTEKYLKMGGKQNQINPPQTNEKSINEQSNKEIQKKNQINEPITYFRVFNSGLYQFFNEKALIGNSAIKRINLQYSQFIETDSQSQNKVNQLLTKELLEQIDSSLAEEKINIEEFEEQFQNLTKNPNFLFLMNLFKQNYEVMSFNSYFNQKHQKEIRLYMAVLDLYGCLSDSQSRPISDDKFLTTVLIFSQNMQSNKKALHQLLSLFVESVETNISSISESFNTQPKMLNSFATVFFNHSRYDEEDMNLLLKQTQYSSANQAVITNILSLYHGDLDKLMELIKFSKYFANTNDSYQELSQFILSFDTDKIMSENMKDNRIRLLSFQTLKLDFEENREVQQDILFKLSKKIMDDKSVIKNIGLQINRDENKLQIKREGQKSRYIDQILRNEWNFLFNKDIKNYIEEIFSITKNQLDIVKLFCLLRSNSSLKISSELISKKLSKKYIEKITQLLLSLKIINHYVHPGHLQILLGLSSNMPLLALDGILKFYDDFSINQSPQIKENPKKQNDGEENKNQKQKTLLVLRSMLIFKQLIVGDPEQITKLQEDEKENIYISIQFFISHFFDKISSFQKEGNSSVYSGIANHNSEVYYCKTFDLFSKFMKRSKNQQLSSFYSSYWNENSNLQTTNEILNVFKTLDDKNKSLQFFGLKFFTSSIIEYLLDSYECLSFLKALVKSQFEIKSDDRDKDLHEAFKEESFFIKMVFQDKKIDPSIKEKFGKLFFNLNQSFYVLQSNDKQKTQKLITNLKIVLEECFSISRNNQQMPEIIKQLLEKMSSQDPSTPEKLFNIISTFLVNDTDFGEYFNKNQDDKSFPSKLILIFNQLEGIFVRPSISLSNESVQAEVINALLLIGGDLVNEDVIKATISIIQGNIKGIYQLLSELSLIGQNELNAIKSCVNSTQKLSIYKNKQQLQEMQDIPKEVLDDQIKDILKRIEEGQVDLKDIFRTIVFKEGNNGMISLDSFSTFLSRTGIELSSHRRNEIFAIIKKEKKTKDSKDSLSEEEFELAYEYVTQKKIGMTLEQLGISPALLTLTLGTLIIILILLFAFIFLGIKAFTLGGTFGSIINSIIPMAAAQGAANSQDDKSENLTDTKIKTVLKETENILHSKQL